MSKRKNILIVDDFINMQQMTKAILREAGDFVFYTAENGLEGLSFCRNKTVDLIITDWNMPKMNGLEFLAAIRSDTSINHIPVIMITAEAKLEQVQKAINLGINAFIIKPFAATTLIEKVSDIISGKSKLLNPINDNQKISSDNESKSKATVLVVDDSPLNIDVIVRMLKDSYKIVVANNGAKALKIAEKSPKPDLILLDVMMPEMDRLEVCRQLKNNPLVDDIPIIFLTSKTDAKTALSGLKLGAVDYIHKPIEAELLKARVKNHINLKQAHDEMKRQIDTLIEHANPTLNQNNAIANFEKPLQFIIHQANNIAKEIDSDSANQAILQDIIHTAKQLLDNSNPS